MMYTPGFRITKYDMPRRIRTYNPDRRIRNTLYLAFSKSFSSQVHTGKHCAVLLDKYNRIVKTFVNCHTKDPLGNTVGTIHAEEGLILNIINYNPDFDFSESKIIVVRGNYTGDFSNSAPCDKCLSLMSNVGVGQIIFTSQDNILRSVSKI